VQRLLLSIAISALVSRARSKYATVHHCSMSSVRNWAAGWAIAALILFSFVVAYSAVSAADILIDPLGEVEALVFLCLLPAVVIGWILFRGMS